MEDQLRVQFLEQLEKEYQTNSEQIKILTQRNYEIFKIMKEFSQTQISEYQSTQNSASVIQKQFIDIKQCLIKTSSSLEFPDCVQKGLFMFHTEQGLDQFWQMDMKKNLKISRIILTNRTDMCQERINPAIIQILDSSQQLKWQSEIKTTEAKYYWDNINTEGQFIKVQLTSKNCLHFANLEVEIEQ